MQSRPTTSLVTLAMYAACCLYCLPICAEAQTLTDSPANYSESELLSIYAGRDSALIEAPSIADYYSTQVLVALDPQNRNESDPVELAPFTDGGKSVTIPDYTLSDLLFRIANSSSGLQPFSDRALQLWQAKVPLSAKSQALYDATKLLYKQKPDPFPIYTLHPNGTIAFFNYLAGHDDITTLAGMSSFWFLTAPAAILSNDCDCRGNARQANYRAPRGTFNSYSLADLQTIFFVESSPLPKDQPDRGWTPGKQHSKDCSPRFFSHGRLRYRPLAQGKTGYMFPVTHDVVQAQFDMVSDILRNDTAVSLLETMQIDRKARDEIGSRIMKVAGLPDSSLGNLRGWLTIRQYALYQALQRGDNDCPIPVTACGKLGPNPCDVYPARGSKR